MALSHTISLLMLLCLAASTISPPPPPSLLHLPVWKDCRTLQYVTGIKQRTPPVAVNLTLDLGGRQLWVDCDEPYISSTYSPARCGSPQCTLVANSKSCFINDCFFPSQPGCFNDTCGLVVDNPVAGIVTGGEVGMDVVYVRSLDPLRGVPATELVSVPGFLFTCGASFVLEGLPDGVSGVAGLGRTEMSFPSQLSAALNGGNDKTFALCLGPTTGAVVFSPWPSLAESDVAKSLIFTSLLTNPVSTGTGSSDGEASSDYFVGVKSIKVNGNLVKLNATLLLIDEKGHGGAKISTVEPYTVLQSTIYDAVVTAFVDEAGRGRNKMTRVDSVGPFRACFDASGIRMTRTGPAVPSIEVEFGDAAAAPWQILGWNSMVWVGEEVVCLGLVDGGVSARAAVVIGGYQLEDNLVVFDVGRSRVGFSSLPGRMSCAGFIDEIATMEYSSTIRDSTF